MAPSLHHCASSLPPPKLTVPLILFFLPVLFIVIMAPAMIKVFDDKLFAAAASRL